MPHPVDPSPMNKHLALLAVAAATTASGITLRAEDRSQVPEKYTWNLADLYASPQAWTTAKEQLAKRVPELGQYRGRLGDSAATLRQCLTTAMELDKDLSRLLSYANQLVDQDTRVASNLEMLQAAEQVAVQLSTASSFIRPEILALEESKVKGFIGSDPGLKEYGQFLDNILRGKPHTRTPGEEEILAQAGNIRSTGDSVYTIFANADLPYPVDVKLPSGEVIPRLDAAAYTRYRASTDRADREAVFKAFWTEYARFTRTCASTLYGQTKSHMFEKDVRKFPSCLEASLFANNIPTNVYRQLIADVHANLPTLHRYLKLRQKMLGVDQLRYEDLYAPILKAVKMSFTPEQAMEITLKAFAPLGPEYVAALKKGYDNRWVDFLPSTGKKSGAYSNGAAYEVHPYQLLNFMGQYEDLSTLAHESGHSMHSYLSNLNQPYVNHDYSIFVAEVASTLNENLLLHYMLREVARDNETRLFLLGSHLDGLRQTLFRQTLFAEFELAFHEVAERGEGLTNENLDALYLRLLKEYYGDAQGICKIDDLYRVEWAYIPHFYYNFYVYQYATSMTASTAIAELIRTETGTAKARDAYLKMLSSGSSAYPIALLKGAGVDMTTPVPFRIAMKDMNDTMDRMEQLLGTGSGK
jgi:oligoendopeptidase F